MRLALHSTDGQTGDEVLLEEGVDAGDGDGDHEGDGHTDGFLRHVLFQLRGGGQHGGGVLGQVIDVVLDLVQHGLQGAQLIGADVQLSLEPVVPVAEGQEQADGGQHGLGDGQDDLGEDRHLAGAVDLGGLDDGVGNGGAEEGSRDRDIPARNRQRQDQDPHAVLQVQDLGGDDVACGHAAAEDHGCCFLTKRCKQFIFYNEKSICKCL